MATTTVHGFQATLPGGTAANALAQTGTNGAVGTANALVYGAAPYYLASAPGAAGAGLIPIADASSRVYDSQRLQGMQTGSGSGQIPVLDSNGAVARAEQLVTAGQTFYIDQGQTAFQNVQNANNPYAFSVTFNHVFSSAPRVVASIASGGSVPVQYGMQLLVYNVTTTGCTIEVGQTTGSAQSLAVSWLAFGS
jgi:hypothetical protein